MLYLVWQVKERASFEQSLTMLCLKGLLRREVTQDWSLMYWCMLSISCCRWMMQLVYQIITGSKSFLNWCPVMRKHCLHKWSDTLRWMHMAPSVDASSKYPMLRRLTLHRQSALGSWDIGLWGHIYTAFSFLLPRCNCNEWIAVRILSCICKPRHVIQLKHESHKKATAWKPAAANESKHINHQ